jgi:hypothetical protein
MSACHAGLLADNRTPVGSAVSRERNKRTALYFFCPPALTRAGYM